MLKKNKTILEMTCSSKFVKNKWSEKIFLLQENTVK